MGDARFGPFRLDLARRELKRDGRSVPMGGRAVEILCVLVSANGDVVTKDDLMAQVWPGVVVAENNIQVHVSALRKALGEEGTSYIVTVPGRGYRFVGLDTSRREGPLGPAEHPALPDKPSIAVLPFQNLSGEPEQEYLADGLSEEIIAALSKVGEMLVIARNSTFAYKGKSPDIRQVARELGVGSVLEGSVRKAANRVRITAELIDAATGHHLWAERYERELIGIFDLQDEITQEVVTALQVRLTEGEQARLRRRQTHDISAWELFIRAQAHLRRFNREDNLIARTFLERAIDRDADFAAPWSHLAWTHLVDARLGYTASADVSLEQGASLVLKCLSLDEANPDAHAILGAIRLLQRRYDEAESECRRAIDLGPNVAEALMWLATVLNYTGRAREALGLIEKAMRLTPFYPDWYLGIQGVSYRLLGRFKEAIEVDLLRLARNPDQTLSNFRLAAVFSQLGQLSEARAHIADLLKKNPHASIRQVRVSEPYQDVNELQRYLNLLRKVGLPE